MVDTFVQTHRVYNTKSEHCYNIRTLSGVTRYMGTLYFCYEANTGLNNKVY